MARLKGWSRNGFSPFAIEQEKKEPVERPARETSTLAHDCSVLIHMPEFHTLFSAMEEQYMGQIRELARTGAEAEKVAALMHRVAVAHDVYSFAKAQAQGLVMDEKNNDRRAQQGVSEV